MSAGCAFYAMLALFPGISIFVSLYGLLSSPLTAERQVEAIAPLLPSELYDLVANRVKELASAPPATLGWNILLSTVLALWSASAASRALMTSLNVAYYEEEKRSLLAFYVTAFILTACGIIGMALGLTVVVAVPVVLAVVPFGSLSSTVLPAVTWLLFAAVVFLGLAALYRIAPSRRQAKWRWITPGSAVAAMLMLLSALFSLYVRNFASYNVTYGSLGAIVVALFWFYLSAYVTLVGARVNAELELETALDTTVGWPKPPGRRGAFVADHVAP